MDLRMKKNPEIFHPGFHFFITLISFDSQTHKQY